MMVYLFIKKQFPRNSLDSGPFDNSLMFIQFLQYRPMSLSMPDSYSKKYFGNESKWVFHSINYVQKLTALCIYEITRLENTMQFCENSDTLWLHLINFTCSQSFMDVIYRVIENGDLVLKYSVYFL